MKRLLNFLKNITKKNKGIILQDKVYIDCKDLFLIKN